MLVTTLKNRISFLQHSQNLQQNALDFYEALIRKVGSMPVLPAQSVVVQTGGVINAPTYPALHSPHALLGDGSTADNSLRIAVSFAERRDQIEGIDRVLALLHDEAAGKARDQAMHNLSSVKGRTGGGFGARDWPSREMVGAYSAGSPDRRPWFRNRACSKRTAVAVRVVTKALFVTVPRLRPALAGIEDAPPRDGRDAGWGRCLTA